MVGEAEGVAPCADDPRVVGGTAQVFEDQKVVGRALRPGGTSAAFQPIAELRSGRVIGLEALARISTPGDGGICEVLEAASRAGRRVEFELALVRRALRAAWDQPRALLMFINASPETFIPSRPGR